MNKMKKLTELEWRGDLVVTMALSPFSIPKFNAPPINIPMTFKTHIIILNFI